MKIRAAAALLLGSLLCNAAMAQDAAMDSSSGSEAAAAKPGLGGNWNRLQILVVITWKPAGSARIAGEPNMVSACRIAISEPASMAGSTSGSVTVRSTRARDAPRFCAASSTETSTDLNAAITGSAT